MEKFLITIDGPAGAGKTTVSKMLASKLDYRYIDTGALYRGVAIAVAKSGIDPENNQQLAELCQDIHLQFVLKKKDLRLLLNSEDITDQLRTPKITMQASALSAKSIVRRSLLNLQRKIGAEKGVVFEGRDMGTVVFPNAEKKFFLIASHEIRAKRRFEELKLKTASTLEEVKKNMAQRDKNDSTRALAPLKPADDAIQIDSSDLSIEKVVAQMLDHIHK